MATKKKTSSMIWLSPSPSAKKKLHTLSVRVPDWSLLPDELLNLISEKLGDSFDAAIHARSVCRTWRSTFSYPSRLLSRTTYSLPSFEKFPFESTGFCTLQNFPVFLFIVRAPAPSSHSQFLLGGIVREDHADPPSPIQCSVKMNIPWSDPTSINMRDCQILPLGVQSRLTRNYDPRLLPTSDQRVAFLPLTNKGGGEFVVLLAFINALLVLTSSEMRWKRFHHGSIAQCQDIVTFRGRFYVLFLNGDMCVIDPYSLKITALMPPPLELENCGISTYFVPSGDDELFMVEKIIPRNTGWLACRVSKLDKEAGEWVVVTDLGDRVLLIGPPGNRTCSGKELPDGCGVSGNSMLFIDEPGGVTYPFKYGVDTRCEEDYLDLNLWRSSRENRVTILSSSPNPRLMKSPVVSLRIER